MRWTCDKCGKTLEISTEQLTETQGVVVCPQCLGTAVVPGYKRRRAAQSSTESTAPPPSKPDNAGTPPPRRRPSSPSQQRKTISFVDQPSTPPPRKQPATAPDPRPKPKKKKRKKSSSGGCLAPHTSWGCLWRSVVGTLVFLALYSALGFLLQCT